jgi:hypothetical protein
MGEETLVRFLLNPEQFDQGFEMEGTRSGSLNMEQSHVQSNVPEPVSGCALYT